MLIVLRILLTTIIVSTFYWVLKVPDSSLSTLCKLSYWNLQEPCEVATIISLALQMGKLRLIEVKQTCLRSQDRCAAELRSEIRQPNFRTHALSHAAINSSHVKWGNHSSHTHYRSHKQSGNRGSDKLSNLPKFTQSASDRAGHEWGLLILHHLFKLWTQHSVWEYGL